MKDDVVLSKIENIERCIERIQEEYVGSEDQLETNSTKQDSILLNLQRVCESAIDLGTRIIRIKQLGLPESSRDVFAILENAEIISSEISSSMQAMVGFRNIVIHQYEKLDLDIVKDVLENRLDDFYQFNKTILSAE